MNDFERELDRKFNEYYRRHLEYPKSISLSYEFSVELDSMISAKPTYINSGTPLFTSSWRGCTIKYVHRKNYIEMMPRRKKSKQKEWKREILGMHDKT